MVKMHSVLAKAAVAAAAITLSQVAMADGMAVFNANCAACHAGGGNIIDPNKTLSKEHLDANGVNSAEAVLAQVTNGAGAMPPFGHLPDADRAAVAQYVIDQAAAGWK
jgi:cytochrome c6